MSAALKYDSPDLNALLAKVRELAVLPHVVYKVLEISGTTDSSTAEIERVIVVDPGFSSKLLTVANSAYYALPRKVTSIREAILFLGFKTIRQIAMTVGLYDMFIGKTDRESMRRRTWWRHSVDTAVASRWLAKQTGKLPPDDAYTCGLLHLIGKTLLDRFGGKDYESVEVLIRNGFPDATAEINVYGCDHVQVARAASEKWGFPEPLVNGLQYLEPCKADEENAAHRACVAIATRIALWAVEGSPDENSAADRRLPQWAMDVLLLDAERHDEIVRGGAQAIAEAATMSF